MLPAVVSFVDQVVEAASEADFEAAMAQVARHIGLQSFAYLVLPNGVRSRPLLISNYAREWTDHYIGNHYQRLDPVIGRALKDRETFVWDSQAGVLRKSKAHERFFDEAADFRIHSGMTIPVHDPSGLKAAVTFAGDQRIGMFERLARPRQNLLEAIAATLHAHARSKLLLRPRLGDKQLTHRERECLRAVAAGKKSAQIGAELGIQGPSVLWHLANCRAKLEVATTPQAIAKAARLGLL